MKHMKVIGVVIVVLLLVTGGLVYKAVSASKQQAATPTDTQQTTQENVAQLDPSVTVDIKKSTSKDNTVVLSISGLNGKYTTVAYELSYDTQGVMQGVTSKPLDLTGKDTFLRDDIYLGTCSRNVCRPHLGVKKVSLALEFTDTAGKKSQFSKDYDI